jgi:hypothetical protein
MGSTKVSLKSCFFMYIPNKKIILFSIPTKMSILNWFKPMAGIRMHLRVLNKRTIISISIRLSSPMHSMCAWYFPFSYNDVSSFFDLDLLNFSSHLCFYRHRSIVNYKQFILNLKVICLKTVGVFCKWKKLHPILNILIQNLLPEISNRCEQHLHDWVLIFEKFYFIFTKSNIQPIVWVWLYWAIVSTVYYASILVLVKIICRISRWIAINGGKKF